MQNLYQLIEEKENTQQNVYQRMTEPVNGNSSIIKSVFANFLEYTNQVGNPNFFIRPELFERWKTDRFGQDFELTIETFRDIHKRLYVNPRLHELASRGHIRKKHIEEWARLEPLLPNNLDEVDSADYLTNLLEQTQM